MNILVTNNHVIYNSHNPDIDHKKEPAKNPGDSDFFYRLCPVLSDDFCICVHVHNALCLAYPISTNVLVRFWEVCPKRVNALYRAYPISTEGNIGAFTIRDDCVNALHRAYPISTNPRSYAGQGKQNVSMPYIGLIPFLRCGGDF